MTQFIDVVGFLLVFGSVLFLAYIATKFVGKNAARTMKSKNMEVIETLKLGVDKQLYIVRAGDRHVLLASSGKNMEYICELNLDEDMIEGQSDQQTEPNEFNGILEKYLYNLKPQEGLFRGVPFKRKERDIGRTDFANNIRKLQNINNKIDSEDVRHDK